MLRRCSAQIDHLDGRKLLVESAPGDVTVPTSYDPFGEEGESLEFVQMSNTSSTLEPMAQAELTDVAKLKQVTSLALAIGLLTRCVVRGIKSLTATLRRSSPRASSRARASAPSKSAAARYRTAPRRGHSAPHRDAVQKVPRCRPPRGIALRDAPRC